MAIKKEGLERVGLRLPEDVKDWYMKESLSLGLTMSQYMSFVLVTHKRNQDSAHALKSLADLSKNSGLMEANRELIEMFKSPDFQEFVKKLGP